MGKNTVVRALEPLHQFHFAVSATTRARRPEETDGVEYHFVSEDEFTAMVESGRLMEWAEFAGSRYGTPYEEVASYLEEGTDVVLDVELSGAFQVMKTHPDATSIFLMPPSLEELETRMRGRRGMAESEIRTRLGIAETQIEKGWERFAHIVVNADLDATVSEIAVILRRYPT